MVLAYAKSSEGIASLDEIAHSKYMIMHIYTGTAPNGVL
jgi:hypothetical protein